MKTDKEKRNQLMSKSESDIEKLQPTEQLEKKRGMSKVCVEDIYKLIKHMDKKACEERDIMRMQEIHLVELANIKFHQWEQLEKQNKLLKRKLDRAMECVDKYADKNYWKDGSGRGSHYDECPYEDIEEVWDNKEDKPFFLGGYQARIAKKQIEEME